MPEPMRILFVDDDPAQVDLFQEAVADWNRANQERPFDPVVFASVEDGRAALRRERFDAALFDLKFRTQGGLQLSGNDLARVSLGDYGIPTGIISGGPGDFAGDIEPRQMIRTFAKTPGAIDEAVAWIGDLWPMLTALASAREHIRRSEAEVFVRRLWPQWANYPALPQAGAGSLDLIVARQFAGYIAESMGAEGAPNALWHPFEAYTFPAAMEHRPHTGDIYELDDKLWVVLTPQCDMASGKADPVLLALCDPAAAGLQAWQEKSAALATRDAEGKHPPKPARYFSDLINQNNLPSQHFLPPLEGRALIVEFKHLRTEALDDLQNSLGLRKASVSSPFLMNLIQRFGAYVTRPGQPDIDIGYFAAGQG